MTPLCDVLRSYAARNPARFHMPGHKGGPLPLPELSAAARLDVTEIPGTGNLYLAGEPFDSAQKPWAERFGFDHCQFLTGGSTMGIHTGLSLLCAPGDQILVDRNCHRAVFNAMALLDLEPGQRITAQPVRSWTTACSTPGTALRYASSRSACSRDMGPWTARTRSRPGHRCIT